MMNGSAGAGNSGALDERDDVADIGCLRLSFAREDMLLLLRDFDSSKVVAVLILLAGGEMYPLFRVSGA